MSLNHLSGGLGFQSSPTYLNTAFTAMTTGSTATATLTTPVPNLAFIGALNLGTTQFSTVTINNPLILTTSLLEVVIYRGANAGFIAGVVTAQVLGQCTIQFTNITTTATGAQAAFSWGLRIR